MWFQPKNIHFGCVVHKLCPKTPKFCWFGAKMGLAHNFLWINNIKTMWFAPSDILFGCLPHVYWAIWDGSGPAHANVFVPALRRNISRSRIFPNKLLIQTDREKYRESRKIVIWISHCFWLPCWFSPNFFFHFFKLEIFWEWTKWPSRALN